ncbi:hypothetical protein [Candidatus Pyrohabitans sp.]
MEEIVLRLNRRALQKLFAVALFFGVVMGLFLIPDSTIELAGVILLILLSMSLGIMLEKIKVVK